MAGPTMLLDVLPVAAVDLDQLFQTLVDSATLGSVYALIALGYTMVYGILKLLNFAHGDVFMIGAYIGLGVLQLFGGAANPSISIWLVLVLMRRRGDGRLRRASVSRSSASPTGRCAPPRGSRR